MIPNAVHPQKSRAERIREYRLLQPIEVLKRNAEVARRRACVTQEELDYAEARARYLWGRINPLETK